MSEHPKYRVVTIADMLNNIPAERFEAFLSDLPDMLRLLRKGADEVKATLGERFGGLEAGTAFEWIDDGEGPVPVEVAIAFVPTKD